MISITLAAEENIHRILEIESEAISPPWSEKALFEELGRDDSYFIVAVNRPQNNVAGFAILRQVGDDGELLQIAVDKSARRCGIGDVLIDAVLKYSEEKNYNSVFLEVRSGNEAAIRMYEKHGFTLMRIRRDYYIAPDEDAFVMVKAISSQ